ncbi:hypothetical protein SAMN04488066_103108 [Halorubrum aquaticum]|uniref:Uncharacterized protein n=1 Tax=Halorubrum aquaticum TaxID=387340 RepID=A0A1I2ZTY1_9EURY|nr:hypothetical protein [Halorubrum aquaticum]SFH41066.1 hypothetical protein SAMN04488066_103108 [Halorubrum aquaticum]
MEYQPGVCNIGPTQRRRRLLLGGVSILAAAALVAAVLAVGWPHWTLVLTTFPLYGAAMGCFQYRERFCVGFAGVGVFDVGEGTERIDDPEALAADRKRAVRLNVKSLAVGALGALAIYGIAAVAL